MFRFTSVLLLSCFATTLASADTIYLSWSGTNAAGDINGTAFSASAWTVEIGVDDAAADTNAAAINVGEFAYSEMRIDVGGTLYELTDTGTLALSDTSVTDEHVDFDAAAGGEARGSCTSCDGPFFPGLFTDPNSLASAVLEASTTQGGFMNAIDDGFTDARFTATTGEKIAIQETGGSVTTKVSATSISCTGNVTVYGSSCSGNLVSAPTLAADGCVKPGGSFSLDLTNGPPNANIAYLLGVGQTSIGIAWGCTLYVQGPHVLLPGTLDGAGERHFVIPLPASPSWTQFNAQVFVSDGAGGYATSEGLEVGF